MLYILNVFIFVLIAICGISQNNKPIQLEFEANNLNQYNIITNNDNLFVLFQENGINSNKWKLLKYNNLLFNELELDIALGDICHFIDYKIFNNYIYFLFSETGNNTNVLKQNFQIVKVNTSNFKYEIFNSYFNKKFFYNSFQVFDYNALIVGKSKTKDINNIIQGLFQITFIPQITGLAINNSNSRVFNFSFTNKNTINISPKLNGYSKTLSVSNINNTPIVLSRNIIRKKQDNIIKTLYDKDFQIINSEKLFKEDSNKHINYAKYFNYNDKNYIYGTYYYSKNKHSAILENDIISSTGLFIGNYENDKYKYYPFINFKNFYNFIETDNQLSKKKVNKTRDKLKQKIGFQYNIIVHDIIEYNNELILIGECFVPEYRTEFQTVYNYGMPETITREVFEGYKYTHAFIVGFDKDLNLKWENSIEIMDIISFNLYKRISVLLNKNEIVLAYNNNGKIMYKIINKDKVTSNKKDIAIKSDDNEKVIDYYNSEITHWYANFYLASGYKRIKTKGILNNKTYFYLTKIGFN